MSANAQYKKGDIELEGEVSYTNIEGINSYKIAPEVNILYPIPPFSIIT